MVPIHRNQCGLVQDQQIATLLLPATDTIILNGQRHASVLLPIDSLDILRAIAPDPFLNLCLAGNCGVS
jgi:hypothetical protein